jgi:hypothetical protein
MALPGSWVRIFLGGGIHSIQCNRARGLRWSKKRPADYPAVGSAPAAAIAGFRDLPVSGHC